MKVKDFIEVYDDGYLMIETEKFILTDNEEYIKVANEDKLFGDKPVKFLDWEEYPYTNKEIKYIYAFEFGINRDTIFDIIIK